MAKLSTTTVSLAVTPTVVSTLFSHYLNRQPLHQRPTAHLSYHEGLHLIRSFLEYASHHTVEELQAFTAQWVPHPQWVKVEETTVAQEQLRRAAQVLIAQLGPDGIRQVGGQEWWQWRKPGAPLQAEWIEMRADAHERKRSGQTSRRIIMYIHGGAYFFGSVDEHRYQMQRHARKLKARVFAPKYRLSPQFPFPCGLVDCLAAYLFLLTQQDASTVLLAGDSAGGGMVLALLCLLRDQGIALPAGAILISPWVDLTHSFPSVSGEAPLDYIPQAGFHHRPSPAWPPPNTDDLAMLRQEAAKKTQDKDRAIKDSDLKAKQHSPIVAKDDPSSGEASGEQVTSGGLHTDTDKFLSVMIDGELVTVKDQIQMYTTNTLLSHPLVSPVMQPTLGGLPPLLIMVGGGEILRDEQIYLAHKCAHPEKYAPADDILTDKGRELLAKYKPTDVQLQVWDHLCHVAPTLSFTRPAKFMYRSIAQFGAWALARAQKTGIEILDDDDISIITSSASDSEAAASQQSLGTGHVGKAGDALPPFRHHMIRQRVTRHGATLPLAPESELPGCCVKAQDVGVIKEGPVKKWMAAKKQWDAKYSTAKAKVHKKIIKDMVIGYQEFGPGERPPPSALASRRVVTADLKERKRSRSLGLSLWSLWGSKHDEMTVVREEKADRNVETQAVTGDEGRGARPYSELEAQQPEAAATSAGDVTSRSRSRRRVVVDEDQTGNGQHAAGLEQEKQQQPDNEEPVNENTPVAVLMDKRRHQESSHPGLLSPNYVPETGVAGKRPFLGGIALPFSLGKEADTASMLTLNSALNPAVNGSQPATPAAASVVEATGRPEDDDANRAEQMLPGSANQRPALDTFVTAQENLPQLVNRGQLSLEMHEIVPVGNNKLDKQDQGE
ncbi:hypothetical protein CDD81_444 [Ophiocordyceps australis]|uniref:Alpha/beta hydrolase fold-3 domain-containing protein n=1 Tax=Ophiocordyceps australis TaxID=1399860 RepID=A0A2C5Y117_9HYPO|nr:hypothetical protein CDD81_444 [Ophiocordyceps australis]